MTFAEFDALPENEDWKRELIDGEVYEMASGGPVHERVKGIAILKLAAFVENHQLNACFQSETRYYLPNGIDVFQPDISLVLGDKLDPKGEGKITVVPDLAVEVVSSESAQRLQHKVRVLLDLGARAVVVIYPEDRDIYIHRAAGIERVMTSGTLALEDVLPGFAIAAAVLFEGI